MKDNRVPARPIDEGVRGGQADGAGWGRPTRVLLIVAENNVGGVCQGIAALLTALDKTAIHVTVAIPPGPYSHLFAATGARVINVRIKHALDISALPRLASLVRRGRFDIVRTHMLPADVIGGGAALLAGGPVRVKTFHGWLKTGSRTKDGLYLLLEALAGRIAHRLTAETGWAVCDFARRTGVPRDKLRLLPPGVDITPFAYPRAAIDVCTELGLIPDAPLIILLGRLVRQKGQQYFIEAAVRVRGSFPRAQFLLVGDGCDRVALEAVVYRANASSYIHFAGRRGDVVDLLNAADMVVVPSLWEEFGLVNIEAMAAGKPIIASHVDSIPEIVPHGEVGLLVPPADAAALAGAMVTLLNDHGLAQKLGEAGRRRVAAYYTTERYAAATADLYRELMETA